MVFLQDKTQKKSQDALVDHSYELINKTFTLETDDIISVNINHLQLSSSNIINVERTSEIVQLNKLMMHPYIYGFIIDTGNNVNLPIIGKIKVGGLTIEEAQNKIEEASASVYSDPVVTVFLLNNKISVLGEVTSEGTYPVYKNRISVFDALGEARGFKDFANRSEVRILRTRGGKNRLFHIDLTDENLLASENLFLQPNDVIFVKQLKRKKFTMNDNQQIYRILGLIVSIFTLYALIQK